MGWNGLVIAENSKHQFCIYFSDSLPAKYSSSTMFLALSIDKDKVDIYTLLILSHCRYCPNTPRGLTTECLILGRGIASSNKLESGPARHRDWPRRCFAMMQLTLSTVWFLSHGLWTLQLTTLRIDQGSVIGSRPGCWSWVQHWWGAEQHAHQSLREGQGKEPEAAFSGHWHCHSQPIQYGQSFGEWRLLIGEVATSAS